MKTSLQFTFVLALGLTLPSIASAGVVQEHQGRWLGEMKVPDGRQLKIGANFFTRADGTYWASVSSPDQNVYDIPVKSIKESGDTLELDLGTAAVKLTWSKDHFNSEWIQGPAPLALTMNRVKEFPKKIRIQAPKAPFPYTDLSLAIASTDGVTLGATLSIPNGKTNPNVRHPNPR